MLSFDPAKTSIILAGSWNLAIFQPNWIGERVLQAEEADVSFGLLSTGGIRAEFKRGNVSVVTLPGRVEVWPRSNDPDALQEGEQLAARFLQLLPETPMLAFGINFEFSVDREHPLLMRDFQVADTAQLQAIGGSVEATVIQRALRFGESTVNLILTLPNIGMVNCQVNHNYDVPGPANLAEQKLAGATVRAYTLSQKILSTVYGGS